MASSLAYSSWSFITLPATRANNRWLRWWSLSYASTTPFIILLILRLFSVRYLLFDGKMTWKPVTMISWISINQSVNQWINHLFACVKDWNVQGYNRNSRSTARTTTGSCPNETNILYPVCCLLLACWSINQSIYWTKGPIGHLHWHAWIHVEK